MIDNALLRPGRLGKLIYVPLPSPEERCLILKALGRKKPVDESVDLNAIALMPACESFSGVDLSQMVSFLSNEIINVILLYFDCACEMLRGGKKEKPFFLFDIMQYQTCALSNLSHGPPHSTPCFLT